MKIKEIKEKEIWENFLLNCKEKTFLQSWNWGEFQKVMGNKIWRLGIYENSELVAVALAVKISARRGKFLFLPHSPSVALAKEGGPVNRKEVLNVLLTKLKEIAKEEKASFIRISPIWPVRNTMYSFAGGERNGENNAIFNNLGFRPAPIHMHAETTWELDITLPEQELLQNMRKTTRYLVRRAPKDGVEVIKSKNLNDLDIFNKIYQETIDRHNFIPFSKKYLKNEFLAFQPDDQVLIFLAKYQEEIISSAIIIFWSGIAFYHHGASSLKHSKIPASYYLQWEAIREAQKRGCKKYNFWGIAPEDKANHPWRGLTLFKMGFGGYKKEYVKTQDLPLSWKYWPVFLFEKLRKTKRGL